MKNEGLEPEWQDVASLVQQHQEEGQAANTAKWPRSASWPLEARTDRPVYGPAMVTGALVNEPTNENGVIFLFGAMAMELGFRVQLIQTAYPDCKALREIAPGRWQDSRIEFEHES